jgi:hypothetical protein
VQAALGSARHAFLKHFKRGLTPLGKLPPYERRRRDEHALHAKMLPRCSPFASVA